MQFVNSAGKESAPFYFWDNKPHECSQTWRSPQRVRSDDAGERAGHGVAAHEVVRVHDVLSTVTKAIGVRIKEDDGSFGDVHAKLVVDATGQNG